MNKILVKCVFLMLVTFFFTSFESNAQVVAKKYPKLKVWFNKPANATVPDVANVFESDPEWLKALPVGNGFLGAMVFGDVNHERIQLNEKSLWSGSFQDSNNPLAAKSLKNIRELLFSGKYREANRLTSTTQVCKGPGSAGKQYGSYQSLGDLFFDFQTNAPYSHYRKELDLNTGKVIITYSQAGVRFKREIFASYPDRAIIIRFTANKKYALNFKVRLTRAEHSRVQVQDGHLLMHGNLDNGLDGHGMAYAARLKAIGNGKISYAQDAILVNNGDAVTLILTASTDYAQVYPTYKGGDPSVSSLSQLRRASASSFDKLHQRHVTDYKSLFDRIRFNLDQNSEDTIPTDIRLQNKDDLRLQQTYFQFGRYLLIASSRKGSLPANLQGIWSNKIQGPWNCDYHTNINLQMNYWPADIANLSECFSPFTDFVESLVKPGSATARIQYGADGWCSQAISNVWGFTSPGEGTSWGLYAAGGGWLAQQLWDHYAFTKDRTYLNRIYPILIGSAKFYLSWLVRDPRTGKLVSGPSTSPENSFFAPDGSVGSITMGPEHDQQIIRGLLSAVLKAGKILKDTSALQMQFQQTLVDLAPSQVAADGRLMEWPEDFRETEPTHRHVSHLFALYPGTQINLQNTAGLALASRKVLESRTDVGTGWSLAWKVNFWARLGDGDRAYTLLQQLLHPTKSYKVNMSNAGGTYPNLFCGHPPFQVDGNFGATAGMAEMLLQSLNDELHLLPAIPKAWANGEISGLKAREGFEVDMKWSRGVLLTATIRSLNGAYCKIRSTSKLSSHGLKTIRDGNYYISKFPTVKGKSYYLTFNN